MSDNKVKELQETLGFSTKNGAKTLKNEEINAADTYCEGYKAFLDDAKTEREAVDTVRLLALTELLHRYALECQYNVGPGHVLGALAAEWENTI